MGRAAVQSERPEVGELRVRRNHELPTLVERLAGPMLICAAVLAVLYLFAFRGRVSFQYPDVLPFWLPTYCFLGKSLAAGHIPAWNPHVMGGVPFAADPQSGWMYVPAMALFTTLPCDVAIRWFIEAQPILAGLGLYWFLTGEGVSRPAATVGGLALALPLAGSHLVLNLPFSGTIAWTALALAAASRYFTAKSWPSRLLWAGVTAGAWGQTAAANLSDGLVIATGALVAYFVGRSLRDVRHRDRRGSEIIAMGALLLVALPLVNFAYFLPRLGYLPKTSIALGYHRLDQLTRQLTGSRGEYLPFEGGTGPAWPARLALSPGVYLGATSLGLAFAGWRALRFRYLAITFAAFGLTCYLLMLQSVARIVGPLLPAFVRSFYVHDPSRFRFGLLVSMAVLAAVGIEGWRAARSPLERVALVAPGVIVWGALPPLVGAGTPTMLLPIGAAGGLAALTVGTWRPALLWLVPAVLAAELSANGLSAQLAGPPPTNPALLPKGPLPVAPEYRRPPRPPPGPPGPINTLDTPTIRASEFVKATALARVLRTADDGRYLTMDRIVWDPRGYHIAQRRSRWGRLGMQQSMLFGLQEAQGYNPTQLLRYWTFVRAAERKPIRYNAGFFIDPPPIARNLLQVEWAIASKRRVPPLPDSAAVRTDGDWMLFKVLDAPPRASLVPTRTYVGSPEQALRATRTPGFNPQEFAVLERPSPSGSGSSSGAITNRSSGYIKQAGTATFHSLGEQEARITVDSIGSSLLLVRNTYDPGWQATIDGRPARVWPADYLVQGIVVPDGHHTVVLRYEDASIGFGLLGSGLAVAALIALGFALKRQ